MHNYVTMMHKQLMVITRSLTTAVQDDIHGNCLLLYNTANVSAASICRTSTGLADIGFFGGC